jgi:hypothetical protein
MQDRQNKINMILGRRGSGKTDYLRGNPKHQLPGFFNLYLNRGIKVLIVDTFDHPSYSDVPIIARKDFGKFKKGVARIIINRKDIGKLAEFLNNHDNTYNTLIVFEDAVKHTDTRIDPNLMQLLIDTKQKNIDVIFMYHSWAQAPLDLYRVVNYIQLFKTKDHPQTRQSAMPDYYDVALKIYNRVKNDPFPFRNLLIDTGNE